MIGAPNTQGQKYCAGIVQSAPGTSVSEEIADIFRNYNIDNDKINIFKTSYRNLYFINRIIAEHYECWQHIKQNKMSYW